MERVRSEIPSELKKKIEESNVDDLLSTCSSFYHFLSHSPLFHSMMEELTNPRLGLCGKNLDVALEFKSNGNFCFSNGHYFQASHFYSKALRVAPFDAADKGNNLVSVLYVNRASSLHKLSLLEEALRDCRRALTLNPKYAKAWYRRGKVNSCLSNFEDALFDLKVAITMEGTESGKRKIEADMKLVVSQNESGGFSDKRRGFNRLQIDEVPQAKLKCVCTPTKGRGMASEFDIHPASLVHREEPYAGIISKNFRDSHCHFCFDELPADPVPCMSCSIPLYCSEHCQLQAGGKISRRSNIDKNSYMLSGELERYFSEVTLESHSDTTMECFTEHRHECHGVNWPAVLPSDVVLAGRMFVKLVELKESSWDGENISKGLQDLFYNYVQLPPDSKVELHVYAVVLLSCIRSSFSSFLGLNGAIIARVVILLSQIKFNSMAIFRLRNADKSYPLNQSEALSLPAKAVTCDLRQVRVGQAIYLSGSLFNHSCVPNVHAYFVSRTLLIRATEFVAAGSSLELSYGPQVGQWDYGRRNAFLQCNYLFKCQCVGCTRVNFPDLVLHAFRCAIPNCLGVVLDNDIAEFEKHKVYLQNTPQGDSLELQRQAVLMKDDETKVFADLVFKQSNFPHDIQSACCLNCGSPNDLKPLLEAADEAEASVKSLSASMDLNNVDGGVISKALNSLQVLKSVLHPYNKKLAEAEDTLAEALCSVGEMQQAMEHCRTSIEILEKIYHSGHIAVGNELLKLLSVQLALGVDDAAHTLSQMDAIFSNYYGKHVEFMFPYLQQLKGQVHHIVAEQPS